MKKIVECVPNFSEGRRQEVVDALAAALAEPSGVGLLDVEMDAAHNRCVISVAGNPDSIAEGVFRAVGKAVELIDLRVHKGEHPRMGAADVIPFIPISGVTMEECVALSVRVAERISGEYRIPTYLYEQSARVAARQDLAYVRKGEFERVREEIRTNPERRPDFGPCDVHPSAGATAVGARAALIAFNVYLHTADVKVAQAIAKAVRHSSGGLPNVKALGFEIRERGQVQVSMNLMNFESTPIFRVFDKVVREAERHGVQVASSEIVGLVPQKALNACAENFLHLENFSERQVLETRLAEALAGQAEQTLEGFVSDVAAPEAVPGGGSVAALAGALAGALGEMASGLTRGKRFESLETRARELQQSLHQSRIELQRLVREDTDAYGSVVDALKFPKDSDEQKANRAAKLSQATRHATEVPLRTAETSARVLGLLEELADIANPNTRSDIATAAQLGLAAVKGGQYNVLINLPGLKDQEFEEECRQKLRRLLERAEAATSRIDALATLRR